MADGWSQRSLFGAHIRLARRPGDVHASACRRTRVDASMAGWRREPVVVASPGGTALKKWIGPLVLALLAHASGAHALPLGPTLQLGAGASFPMQPNTVRDQWNTGFALSGALMFRVAPLFSVGIESGYYRHRSNTDAFEDLLREQMLEVQFSGFDYWFVPVTAVAEVNLLRWGVTKPFLRAGAGVVHISTTDFTASGFGSDQVTKDLLGDYDETVFGTLLGLGVRTPITPAMRLCIDATYHFIQTSDTSTHFLPVRLRVEF